MTEKPKELIAEARERADRDWRFMNTEGADLVRRLADALEAAASERAAVLAPAPDGQVIIPIARIHELRAAKDAAIAALERVRAIAVRSAVNPLIRITEILAALDGAPEPEDEWQYSVGHQGSESGKYFSDAEFDDEEVTTDLEEAREWLDQALCSGT